MNGVARDAQVDAAIDTLQKKIVKIVKVGATAAAASTNPTVSLPPSIAKVLNHARFLWTVLRRQTQILEYGLECFRKRILPSLESELAKTATTDEMASVVQHVFTLLLRLHDGYILTISGECRHPADIEWAKQSTSFPSRLNKQQPPQNMNQQQVYKSTLIYSGTSWDEWNDPHCGVRKRLIDKIRPYWKKKQKTTNDNDDVLLWEMLTEDTLLEALINEFESQSVVHVQSTVTKLIHQNEFADSIQRALRRQVKQAKVTLQFRDKLERLQIVLIQLGSHQQQQTMTFQRYANTFQMNESALPLHIQSVQDWWSMQQFPKNSNNNDNHPSEMPAKRRKRIRIDEEDDLDSGNQLDNTKEEKKSTKGGKVESNSNSGLEVKVVEQPKNEFHYNNSSNSIETTATTTSIRQIKQSYGVEPDQLAESLDILASEELHSQTIADQIDQVFWEQEQIRDARRIVKQRQREYEQLSRQQQKRKRNKNAGSDNELDEELWNAREMLRKACMKAGELLLSKSPQQALQYFLNAKGIVQIQQQNSHVIIVAGKDNEEDDGPFFRRNLILVLGQAQINCGIAHMEMGWKDALRSQLHFTNAIPCFDDAIESANNLHEQSKWDGVDADLRQAQNLRQLAFRWKGSAAWNSSSSLSSTKSQQKELAYEMFRQADGILGSYENDYEFQLERYHTWTTWVDLVTQTMEQMSIRSSTQEWRDRLEEFFEIGIQNTIQTSTILQSIQTDNFGPSEDQEIIILTTAQLLESRKEFRSWWNEQIEGSFRPLSDYTSHASNNNHGKKSTPVSRGDIQSGSYSMSKRPFVLNPQGFHKQKNRHRRSPYNLGGTGYSNMGVSAATSAATSPIAASATPMPRPKYRPWGDIMIDARTGHWIPKLVYPAVAPEMPARIKEILDRRRKQDHSVEG
jgi:hypothetical protein